MGSKILRRGERVRIVRADGCMAHIRNNPREGVVLRIRNENIYGCGNDLVPFAEIRLDNGEIVKKIAERRLWAVCEGLPEYQE